MKRKRWPGPAYNEGSGVLPPTLPSPAPALPSPGVPARPVPELPAPSPAPELPAPRDPQTGRVDVRRYPKGPYDPLDPTPWDSYRYPPTPPAPALPDSARLEREAGRWLKRKLDGEQPAPRPPAPALPGEGRRPALPAPDVPPMLPAGVEMSEAAFKRPVAAGLFGATPLELLGQYLKDAGIRHFSAEELTRHKWRNARGRIARGAAAWAHTLDLFGARLTPAGPWFVLPEHVVPDPSEWPKILPVLRVLDRFRAWLGHPVTVISGYRHPAYNAQIEGASDSRHKLFQAADFYYPLDRVGADGKKRLQTDLFKDWFTHVYRGNADGVGVYDAFVHLDIDTRGPGTGKAQNWDKRTG